MVFPRSRALILAAVCAAGCDIPTSLPSWTTDWEFVAVDQSVSTAELLPAGVRQDPRGFAIDSFSATSSIRLGDVCELCTCFDGPIPGLDITAHDWPVRLPGGLTEAQLLQGKARLVLVNEIGFDPLDDGQGGKGNLEVVLTDRFTGAVFDRRSLTGKLPPADSLTIEFDLARLRVHSGLVARVSGHTAGSGGCPVKLDERSGFRARVELLRVVASSVDVLLSDAALALAPKSVELPAWIARRLRPGEARIALDVDVRSMVSTAAEVNLSVARAADQLFTKGAALETPLMLPLPVGAAPADARGLYLLELEGLPDAAALHFAARTRILGARIVRFTGNESLRYRITMRAEVPSR